MLSILRKLKSKAGLELTNYTITNAALTASETFAPAGMDVLGIFISPGATSTGTSPSLTAALEVSPDGGTTWGDVQAVEGGVTASASPAVTVAGGSESFYCKAPISESGVASDVLYRWVFSYNNADNDFASVNMWLFGRKFNQRHP